MALKIAIISNNYIVNASGSEKGAQGLAEALVAQENEVHVFTSYHEKHYGEYKGVQIHPVFNKLFRKKIRFIYEYVNFLSTLSKIIFLSKKNKIQVLNVHENQMLAVITGIAGRILNIPSILTWIRSDVAYDALKKQGKKFTYFSRRQKAKLALKLVDRIMLKGVCPDMLKQEYGIAGEKIIHISNPVVIPEKAPASYKHQIDKQFGLDGFFIVTTVATRLEKEKGIDKILRMAKSIKEKGENEIKFMIVGGREKSVISFWKEKAKEYQIEDQVVFTGIQKDIYPVLADSDLYVVAVDYEVCCGRAQLEAMVMGLPVICKKTNSIAFWFKHLGNIFLLDDPDVEDFVSAILFLKGNEVKRREIGSSARNTIIEDWNIEKFSIEFTEVCRNLIQ